MVGDDGEKSADAGVACAWGKALVVVKAGDLFAAVDNPSELVLFESRIFVVLTVEDRKDLERSAISRARDGIAENGAGGKMKEAGFDHWNSPNTGATNSSGRTGLPGGARYDGGGGFFWVAGDEGWWWSSSADSWDASSAHARVLLKSSEDITNPAFTYAKNKGYSVRCVRDTE